MDMFLSGKITASVFCDELYYSYDLEIDYNTLNAVEQKAFSDLSSFSSRFSEFKEDHEKCPNAFFRVSPKNRLYRLTCLYNCLLLPHETVGSIKNGVS